MRKTVLLVEDEETDVLMFRHACKKAGVSFAVQAVPDGSEAISYLSGAGIYADRELHPLPSLIIVDINMPKVSGFGVLEWIRNSPEHKHACVVFFTSSYFEKDMARAYDLNVNSYVVKPCMAQELVTIVSMFERFWLNVVCARVTY
jgi:CheY-like chemotaxis protein